MASMEKREKLEVADQSKKEGEKNMNQKLAQTMTNGELYRFAWVAVRQAIENTKKWEPPDVEEIARLQKQEKELNRLMKESFLANV